MDLAEIARIMRRRWYVLLPGLLLTVALTAGAYVKVPVTYQSQSTVVLLNSQKATVAFDGNPYLSTQLALNGMADSLARNLNSDAAIAHLKAEGATCPVVAKIADNALGPLLWLTATGSDQKAVLAADKLMTSYAAERLEQFQTEQNVAPQAMIRMATIVPPQNPVAQNKTRYEYLVLAALMGIVVSMVATFYVEARLRTSGGRGVRRRGAGAPAGQQASAAGEPGSGAGESGQRDEADAGIPGPGRAAERPPARHVPSWSTSAVPGRGARSTEGPGPDARDSDARIPDDPGPGVRGADASPDPDGSAPAGRHARGTEATGGGADGAEANGAEAHRFV